MDALAKDIPHHRFFSLRFPLQALLFGKHYRARLGLEDGGRMDDNLKFIRKEINKKCRRVYQVFLSCYGKMP